MKNVLMILATLLVLSSCGLIGGVFGGNETAKDIVEFTLPAPLSVTGTVDNTNHQVSIQVPFGTDVTVLKPTISHTGASISPDSGAAQDFSHPVVYTVTGTDGTYQYFTVTVTVMASGLTVGTPANVVWNPSTSQYDIELEAHLTLEMDNDAYGAAIVALWNQVHPEAAGSVSYKNSPTDSSLRALLDGSSDSDVLMALPWQMSGYATQIGPIESHTVEIAELNLDTRFYLTSNAKLSAVSALPFAYDGMTFAWNKTMLQALGYSTEVDADNLPAAFNTWEKIFALSNTWSLNRPTYNGSPINIIFPMSVVEPWSGYSSVTAAGWSIFATGQVTQPGFDSPAFLHGLEFIKAAHDAKISVEADGTTTPGLTAGWRWDSVLNDQSAPFGLVGTWMDIKGATNKGNYDMQFSPMPTWEGNRLKPFVKVKVFVINKSSPYPSAAAELLRLLYTKSGMQAMVDNSTYVPSLQSGATIAPNYADAPVTQQLGKAFLQGHPEPVMLTLPNNPNKSGTDLYTNIGLNQFYKDVWDGVKPPSQAQTEIMSAAEQYILTNNQ